MAKVPQTTASTQGASHNPALFYEEQDETGKVRTFFITHPAGNRKQRRMKQRHHPFFTKSRHKGRDWAQRLRLLNAPVVDDGNEAPSGTDEIPFF